MNGVKLNMVQTDGQRNAWLVVAFCLVGLAASTGCGSSSASPDSLTPTAAPPVNTSEANLKRGLAMAADSLKKVDSINSYTFTMLKQERVGNKLLPLETIEMKFRQEPFSIYAKHVKPNSLRGQEAIFVKGKYDDKIVAHGAGLKGVITVVLPPDGPLARMGNRYPITEAGMKSMLKQLQDLAEREKEYLATCDIHFVDGEEVDGRPCNCLEVIGKKPTKTFRMAKARIYMDQEWNVPVKYEAHEFPPDDDAGEPILVESYTYTNLKLNAGLTDEDFDPANKKFRFPPIGRP